MPEKKISVIRVVCLCVLTVGVALAQDGCVEEDNQEAWATLTSQIPYRPYVHTNNFTVTHNSSPACPTISSGYSIGELSLCPWTYEINTDYNRYPTNIAYAVCSCGGTCGSPRIGRRTECKPLLHAFHVLKRVCENGLFRYVFTQERLPIACVCTHVPTAIISPIMVNQ